MLSIPRRSTLTGWRTRRFPRAKRLAHRVGEFEWPALPSPPIHTSLDSPCVVMGWFFPLPLRAWSDSEFTVEFLSNCSPSLSLCTCYAKLVSHRYRRVNRCVWLHDKIVALIFSQVRMWRMSRWRVKWRTELKGRSKLLLNWFESNRVVSSLLFHLVQIHC
jgi:hypothetical protein